MVAIGPARMLTYSGREQGRPSAICLAVLASGDLCSGRRSAHQRAVPDLCPGFCDRVGNLPVVSSGHCGTSRIRSGSRRRQPVRSRRNCCVRCHDSGQPPFSCCCPRRVTRSRKTLAGIETAAWQTTSRRWSLVTQRAILPAEPDPSHYEDGPTHKVSPSAIDDLRRCGPTAPEPSNSPLRICRARQRQPAIGQRSSAWKRTRRDDQPHAAQQTKGRGAATRTRSEHLVTRDSVSDRCFSNMEELPQFHCQRKAEPRATTATTPRSTSEVSALASLKEGRSAITSATEVRPRTRRVECLGCGRVPRDGANASIAGGHRECEGARLDAERAIPATNHPQAASEMKRAPETTPISAGSRYSCSPVRGSVVPSLPFMYAIAHNGLDKKPPGPKARLLHAEASPPPLKDDHNSDQPSRTV